MKRVFWTYEVHGYKHQRGQPNIVVECQDFNDALMAAMRLRLLGYNKIKTKKGRVRETD